ncbi:MAG: hypothetical protein HN700_18980 [Verrucomicrobia bacterium]|nr:hypothetical protein [Verrucomicrobiota bacterium]
MKTDSLHNMVGCYAHPLPEGERRIAWQGISFMVPANWDMAVYKSLRRGGHRVELEDEYSIRLESEWIRAHKKQLKLKRIMKRYEDAAKPLTLKADDYHDVPDLPAGWHATHFIFKETAPDASGDKLEIVQHDLVTAFYLCPESSIFGFFLLHIMPEDREEPVALVQRLAASFQDHGKDARLPYELFDIAFRIPRKWALIQTQFDIGVKLMVFTWRLRRCYLWHFSCADIFLKDGQTPAEWACGYLNGARLLKGPVFYPDGDEAIRWKRRKPFLFGHREEIATLCYKYDVGCRLIEAENKLIVWACNYRSENDLDTLPAPLGRAVG